MFVAEDRSTGARRPVPGTARSLARNFGRFLQADPVGYDDAVNLYAYVGNDPVNGRDPTGMEEDESDIVVTGRRIVRSAGAIVAPITTALEYIKNTLRLPSIINDRITYNPKEAWDDLFHDIPDDANQTADLFIKNGMRMEAGTYYNVKVYTNVDGKLPMGKYKEMEVRQFNRLVQLGPRNRERVVVDTSSGRAYYTADHYNSFKRFR